MTSDSVELSQTCAQSLMRRSKPSPAKTYLREWKAGNLMRLQSGAISSLSLGNSFLDWWTSSLAVTRVSPSVRQDSEKEQTTQDTSGRLFQPELLFCDQVSVSLKTSKDISRWGCPTLSKTWDAWVIEQRGEYSARLNAARLTKESACSSWPTARTSDCHNSPTSEQSGERYAQLRSAVNWPTATSRDWKGAYSKESHKTKNRMSLLPDMVAHWPTPTVQEAGKIGNQANHGQVALSNHPELRGEVTREKFEKGKHGPADPDNHNTNGSRPESWATPRSCEHKGNGPNSKQQGLCNQVVVEKSATLATGKLNPRWVETLMGLPVGWTMPSCASPVTIAQTNYASSVTESSQQQQP